MIDREAQQKRREDRQGYLVIAALVVIVVGAGSYLYFFAPTTRPLDPVTNCPTDGKPPAQITVVLLDTTDPLSAIQNREVFNKVTPEADNAPRYAEIKLFAVEPAGNAILRPLATVCNPGNGEELNKFWASPRVMAQIAQRWREHFIAPLNVELKSLMTAPSANTSPILESIQNVSASVFDAPAFKQVPKQLIIVSDMVQNTPGFSQYRQSETFDQFKHTPYYLTVRPNLDGVNVTILYLRRADVFRIQGRTQHLDFWRDYFTDAGAIGFSSDSING